MNSPRKQILLTNDDGINSPGIWAAAQALAPLGYVTIVAPNVQYSGAGRSHPLYTDGTIQEQKLTIGSQEWPAYAINGSPAQAVMFAVLDVLPERPDLNDGVEGDGYYLFPGKAAYETATGTGASYSFNYSFEFLLEGSAE
jgi:5'-nucleotidase